MTSKSELREYGKDFLEVYDDLFVLKNGEKHAIRNLLSGHTIDCTRSKRLLELGCGNGRIAGFLLDEGWTYRGLDISPEMVAVIEDRFSAEEAYEGAIVGDMTEPYLRDEQFDVILIWGLTMSMLDLDSQRRTLYEAYQHLAPGGKIVFQYARKDLFDDLPSKPTVLRYPRRAGGCIEAIGQRTSDWWEMRYRWYEAGLEKIAVDRVLLTNPKDYSSLVSNRGLRIVSSHDNSTIDPLVFGLSDVIVLRVE